MKAVDINCDMGEVPAAKVGRYMRLARLVTSANIACGFHAGGPETIRETIRLCRENGVDVGAHPSLPDRESFGRREMEMPPRDLASVLAYQVGAFSAVAELEATRVRHLKAHGALYNMASERKDYAGAVAEAASQARLILVAPAESQMARAAEGKGVKLAREGFADRGYTSTGRLAKRGSRGSMVTGPSEAADRALRMVEGEPIPTVDGSSIRLSVDTLCVHGDTPGASEIARAVRNKLERSGVRVLPLRKIL